MLLLVKLPTVTETRPLVALFGTTTVTLELLDCSMVPGRPLNKTCVVRPSDVSPEPFSVIVAPIAAVGGDRLPIVGLATVNTTFELLGTELSSTVTDPVVTPLGTTAAMLPSVQLVMDAAGTPPKLTTLLP
jgi:hypothetical protein